MILIAYLYFWLLTCESPRSPSSNLLRGGRSTTPSLLQCGHSTYSPNHLRGGCSSYSSNLLLRGRRSPYSPNIPRGVRSPCYSPNLLQRGGDSTTPNLVAQARRKELACETTPERCIYNPTSDLKVEIVESIVEKFKDYRKGKWQFAVLFAFPTKDVFEWLELVVKACSKPLNRDANPFYNYKHFIAARPANGEHSEKII